MLILCTSPYSLLHYVKNLGILTDAHRLLQNDQLQVFALVIWVVVDFTKFAGHMNLWNQKTLVYIGKKKIY